MPTATRTSKPKCYIHEMRDPLELSYELHKYHVCPICQSRLLEMAKTNFHFALSNQVISISTAPRVQKAIV